MVPQFAEALLGEALVNEYARSVGRPTATFLTAAAAAGTVMIGAPVAAYATPAVPPAGTSYWVNDYKDLVVIKRTGKKVRMGNALSPCFTGVRQANGRYLGGGDNQQGSYLRQSVTFRYSGSKSVLTWRHSKTSVGPAYPYTRMSRKAALRAASPKPPSIGFLFSDCRLP